jgi:hypothetical protein
VDARNAFLAVLWDGTEDRRLVILTQDPGVHRTAIERFPIPLTESGARAWLAGGSLKEQVQNVRVMGKEGQQTIFEA